MKILVTGAKGFLGKKMMNVFKKEFGKDSVYGTSRKEDEKNILKMDILDRHEVENVIWTLRPDVVVHTAALVDVDGCEKEQHYSSVVNAQAPKIIAEVCEKRKIKMIYFSSDYVFKGVVKEVYEIGSTREPINHYGETKKQGEIFVSSKLENFIIVRPTILYGFNTFNDQKNFVLNVANRLKRGEKVVLDNRRIKYPLLIDDVAKKTAELIKKSYMGVVHMSGPDEVTKYEWGLKIAQAFEIDSGMLMGKDLNETNRPYRVRFEKEAMKGMHGLKEGLEIMIEQMGGKDAIKG